MKFVFNCDDEIYHVYFDQYSVDIFKYKMISDRLIQVFRVQISDTIKWDTVVEKIRLNDKPSPFIKNEVKMFCDKIMKNLAFI